MEQCGVVRRIHWVQERNPTVFSAHRVGTCYLCFVAPGIIVHAVCDTAQAYRRNKLGIETLLEYGFAQGTGAGRKDGG